MKLQRAWHVLLISCFAAAALVSDLQGGMIQMPFSSQAFAKPQLALPTSLTGLRVLQTSTAKPGRASITVAAGDSPTTFALTSSAVSVSPTSGTVLAGSASPIKLTLGWNDTWTKGPRSGVLTLTNIGDPTDVSNHTMTVSGAVVAPRQLTVDAVGSSGQAARAVKNSKLVTSIRSGSNPLLDSDDVATRVNAISTGQMRNSLLQVSYVGTPFSQFNSLNQETDIGLKFVKAGQYEGVVDLSSRMLTTGEDRAVGATVQPTEVYYNVNVVEPRKLSAMTSRIQFGNVLRGANVSGSFVVRSTNVLPDASHTASVNIAPGGIPLGDLMVAQTLVADGPAVEVPISGKLTTYWNGIVRGSVPVASAEAPEVQDASKYRGISFAYHATVGIAKLGSSPLSFNLNETVLSARVPTGETLAGLASKVNPNKTLAANITPASWVREPASLTGLYGGVGSEAVIVDSSELTANSFVTMQWRRRMSTEVNYPGVMPTTLPLGSWLVSDVVKIGGISDSVSYALDMSFDNRINLAFDGPTDGTVANEFPNLFLAQFDAASNLWRNAAAMRVAGSEAEQGVLQSLSDFLAEHSGINLRDLQGSWGVDPVTTDTGLGHAWAIVAGSGIFAVDPAHGTFGNGSFVVTPEPASWVLLLSAAAAILGYLRRKQPGS